ncbi:hypothetical protein H4H29_003632 [Escherichia coli]|uniref:hypothetical protein n=1 Tax=Escherichia coli TaxID=562 RepID=UPI00209108D7|nr:hypothetical protein [Escherichia coli]MCO4959704.1 hypothetical protein [Escherichia coli]
MSKLKLAYDADNPFPNSEFAPIGIEDSEEPAHGGGSGGGSDMNSRMTRIETIAANQEKLISETRKELIGIRGDMHGMERRLADKMDENQKWLIALMISAILAPLFIALVTK